MWTGVAGVRSELAANPNHIAVALHPSLVDIALPMGRPPAGKTELSRAQSERILILAGKVVCQRAIAVALAAPRQLKRV